MERIYQALLLLACGVIVYLKFKERAYRKAAHGVQDMLIKRLRRELTPEEWSKFFKALVEYADKLHRQVHN